MYTTTARDAFLNWLQDGTQPSSFTPYVGLIEGFTDMRAGTVTETGYTGYVRIDATTLIQTGPQNTTPAGGREIANDNIIQFAQNTGAAVDIMAWGEWDASSGGNLLCFGLLDADVPLGCTVDDTGVTGDTIVAPNHGVVVNQRVYCLAAPGLPMPTGISENTNYYVGTVPDADSITLSTASSNGSPVDITADGGLILIPNTVVNVATSATPEIAAAAMKIQF